MSGVFGLSVPLSFFPRFGASVKRYGCDWSNVSRLEPQSVRGGALYLCFVLGYVICLLSFSGDLRFHLYIYGHVCPLVHLLCFCFAILSLLDNEGYL